MSKYCRFCHLTLVTGGYYALLKPDKISLCPDSDEENESILLTSYNDIRDKQGIKLEYVYIEDTELLHNGAFPQKVITEAIGSKKRRS